MLMIKISNLSVISRLRLFKTLCDTVSMFWMVSKNDIRGKFKMQLNAFCLCQRQIMKCTLALLRLYHSFLMEFAVSGSMGGSLQLHCF